MYILVLKFTFLYKLCIKVVIMQSSKPLTMHSLTESNFLYNVFLNKIQICFKYIYCHLLRQAYIKK